MQKTQYSMRNAIDGVRRCVFCRHIKQEEEEAKEAEDAEKS